MNKYLSFGANIAKIAPVDPEIFGLRAIIKKKKKEINLPCGLKSGQRILTKGRITEGEGEFIFYGGNLM